MNKKQINVIFADDIQEFHDLLSDMMNEVNEKSSDYQFDIVKHFLSTRDLKRYFYEKRKADLLLLDIDFGCGDKGTAALGKIKDYAPNLAILLLSSSSDSQEIGPYICDNVDYCPKDNLTADKLLIRIESLLKKIKSNNDSR